jgi:hypothetical protein
MHNHVHLLPEQAWLVDLTADFQTRDALLPPPISQRTDRYWCARG